MKKIIIFILNFLLIIFLFTFSILLILSKTILSKNYVISSLEKSNFYSELNESIQNDFDNYLAKAGIPNGTLNNLYTIDNLKKSVEKTLDSVYYNKPISTDTSIEEKINYALGKYENSNSITVQIANVYERKVTISPKYVNILGQKLNKILPIINTGTIALGVVIVIILVIILLVLHNVKDSLSTIGIASFTTGILAIILKIFVGTKFDNIFLLNDAFSGVIVYIINDIISIISGVGIVISILGLLGIIVGAIVSKKQS